MGEKSDSWLQKKSRHLSNNSLLENESVSDAHIKSTGMYLFQMIHEQMFYILLCTFLLFQIFIDTNKGPLGNKSWKLKVPIKTVEYCVAVTKKLRPISVCSHTKISKKHCGVKKKTKKKKQVSEQSISPSPNWMKCFLNPCVSCYMDRIKSGRRNKSLRQVGLLYTLLCSFHMVQIFISKNYFYNHRKVTLSFISNPGSREAAVLVP